MDFKNRRVIARWTVALSFVLSFSLMMVARQESEGPEVSARERIVVLISIDGLPAEALADPRISAPTLRRLVREGASADAMTTSTPSVTWPSHTSMVTGSPPALHGVLFNGILLRQGPAHPPRVEPWRDKDEMVRVPTVYDLAHEAGLTTAQVDWVAILNAPAITWAFPERPHPEGPVEQEMIQAGLVARRDIEEWAQANITWKDEIWTRAGAYIIENHRPNLLLFHLLNLDSTHHRYGFGNLASNSAIALADARVQALLDSIERAGMDGLATVLVVSDHGFKTATRSIRPNAALRERGLVRMEAGEVNCEAWVAPLGGVAMVYVTNPAERDRLLPQLKQLLGGLEGVEQVIEPAGYAELGLPDPADNDQMGDLLLTAASGYSFSGAAEGEAIVEIPDGAGAHGYPASDPDMDAVFIAWGYGIRPGARLDRVSN
ncbi:MAG TPA: alkaline phosphatase family protein, partial [Acidobacteriota bacterium]|nr:alkaline phosphatase family protein [Acidobacteriota bacterium]